MIAIEGVENVFYLNASYLRDATPFFKSGSASADWIRIALGGIGCLYLTSQIGQQWSADQMIALRTEWNNLIEQALSSDATSVGDRQESPTESRLPELLLPYFQRGESNN